MVMTYTSSGKWLMYTAIMVSAFMLSYLLLVLLGIQFETITKLLWSPEVAAILFGASIFFMGLGVLLVIPGRHGEEGNIPLGTALMFAGTILLVISLVVISSYMPG